MLKFLFYTISAYDKLEDRLIAMEAAGYRTDRVTCNYFFHFKRAKPRKTAYFLTYQFPKEAALNNLELELAKEYHANPVKCSCSTISLWRICVPFTEEARFERERRDYFLHVVKQQMLLSCFFWCCFALLIFFSLRPEIDWAEMIIGILGTVLSSVYFFWKIIAFARLKKA